MTWQVTERSVGVHQFCVRVVVFRANLDLVEPPFYSLPGGFPIIKNDRPLGAIACSGGTDEQDEEAAKAGLGAL